MSRLSSFLTVVFASACVLPAVSASTMSINLTSLDPPNGSWGMERDVAVWIQDNAGMFVKTLAIWGGDDNDLAVWSAASARNRVDAVTSATIANASADLSASWNLTNVSRQRVPNGTYWYFAEVVNMHQASDPYVLGKIVIDGTSKNRTASDSTHNGGTTYFTNIGVNLVDASGTIAPGTARPSIRRMPAASLEAYAIDGRKISGAGRAGIRLLPDANGLHRSIFNGR